jgi:hypothetical protein
MILPEQKLSTKELFKKDKETGLNSIERTANYYIEKAGFDNKDKEILALYKLLEDTIDEEGYDYVLNPLNTKVENYKRFRGRLRNFNIISPVIEMFLSEFGRRNHNPNVIQTNPNDQNDKDKAWTVVLKGYMAQKSINELNKLGVPTGKETVEQPSLNKTKEEFERTYKENRVITGQEALDYIIYDKDLADKYIDLYMNYLVCGRPITYKGVNHNDIEFEIVNPLEAKFPHSVNKTRIEDRDWFIRKWGMTPNQLLDFHGDRLSDDLVKKIKAYNDEGNESSLNSLGYSSGIQYMSDKDFNGKFKHTYQSEDNALNHYHVQFKGFKRIGILKYINAVGEIKEIEVDDDYKLEKDKGDLSIEYSYRNALYQTWKIEFNDIEEFVGTEEVPYDRSEVNNKGKVKLSYNGIALCNLDGEIKSVVKSGQNYQILYNILKFTQEKTMNKNKDKLTVLPLGLFSKGKNGWDEEKTMYYMEAMSTLVIDETSPNAALAIQALKSIDLSLGKYIGELVQMTKEVKEEWWDSIGMNRQRYGDTMASDGKATTEQAIFRSSLISENLVRKFEKLQEKDYAGLLDLSKFAWIDGVKGQYVNSDGRKAFLDLNADGAIYHLESDYDVHVVFSGEENEKMRKAEGFLFNATQNGMSAITALEALDVTSFTKMKEIVKKEEKARLELEQANKDADRASQEKIAQANAQAEQAKNEKDKYKVDMDYEKGIDVATINASAKTNKNDEALEGINQENEERRKNEELKLKSAEVSSKIKKEDAETNKIKKETAIMKPETTTTKK